MQFPFIAFRYMLYAYTYEFCLYELAIGEEVADIYDNLYAVRFKLQKFARTSATG